MVRHSTKSLIKYCPDCKQYSHSWKIEERGKLLQHLCDNEYIPNQYDYQINTLYNFTHNQHRKNKILLHIFLNQYTNEYEHRTYLSNLPCQYTF